jgi:hypothetical protein
MMAKEKAALLGSWPHVLRPPSSGSALSDTIGRMLDTMYRLPPSAEERREISVPIPEALDLRLFNSMAEMKIAVSQVSMHMTREVKDLLFRKLDQLHNADNWEEGDRMAQFASFKTLLRMILQFRTVKGMSLGVSPTGEMLGGWKSGDDFLWLAFLPRDQIRWSVARKIDETNKAASGVTSLDRLGTVLQPYNPRIWFGNVIKAASA